MQRTSDPDSPGFLNELPHATALRDGFYWPRECRWCATPLDVDGTDVVCFLVCEHCDDVEWAGRPHLTLAAWGL
jgi:hypothetical protein